MTRAAIQYGYMSDFSMYNGYKRRMVLMVNFFEFLKLFFCFVVSILDLVHDVKAIHGICKLQTASGNLFLKYE